MKLLGFGAQTLMEGALGLYESASAAAGKTPGTTQKITFTSGTTSSPKGVCLDADQQWQLTGAFQRELAELRLQRHLCLLPFSVLLENIAGPYTALLSGATVICPPLAETGLAGASQFDPQRCLAAIERYQRPEHHRVAADVAGVGHSHRRQRSAPSEPAVCRSRWRPHAAAPAAGRARAASWSSRGMACPSAARWWP